MCSLLLRLKLAGQLLDPYEHELGRLQWGKADEDVHDASVDVRLRGCLRIALDEVRVLGCRTLERALSEERVHERADVQPELSPERLVVGLENDPLQAAVQAFFEVQGCSPHRD